MLREGAQTEATSWVTREKFNIIRSLPGIEKARNGEPLASPELVIIFKLPRHDNPTGSNVNVRGVTAKALEIRPYIKIVEGRMFRSGTNEVIVSRRLQQRLVDTKLGDTLKVGPRRWNVVGVFDAASTSFDSEIWVDLDYLGQVQSRPEYSSVLLKPASASALKSIGDSIATDPRMKLQSKSERKYYVAFNFTISPRVALFAIGLSIVAGVIGGLLPAITAARMPIARALREI